MNPIHGDTVSNDSSSSTWCSCGNQSGVSFRHLPSLQGAKADRILQEKYVSLRENNLFEKLVKTRVLYEQLRQQILSISLNAPSKGNLISGTQPLVVGKHQFKANKSKIIRLVDLVDKGVILRPEKLCECCASSNYNSETRYEYGPKERRHTQTHTGGYLTSKSSIISKKKTVRESRLEIKFKTKNIKSDPCTFKFKEFMQQNSREALKRNPAVQHFNIGELQFKKSYKLKRSKRHLSDGVKMSVSKIKHKQPVKDIKISKSSEKKSLENVNSRLHYFKVNPHCSINVTQKTSKYLIEPVKKKISDQKMQHPNSAFDKKVNQTYYVENWNYNLINPSKISPRNSLQNHNYIMPDNVAASLPFPSDVKCRSNVEYSGTNQVEKSKSIRSDVLSSLNFNSKQSKINLSLTTCKRSSQVLSIDSLPKVDSGLLPSKTYSKTLKHSKILSIKPLESMKTCANKNRNSLKNISMSPSDRSTDFEIKLLTSNSTVLEKTNLEHSKHTNNSQDVYGKSSNIRFNFSNNFIPPPNFSMIDINNLTDNQYNKPDRMKQKIRDHRQKRISKSIKIGSHTLTRRLCTQKLKTMKFNTERQRTSYINENRISINKKMLPRELLICASGEYVSTKHFPRIIQNNTGFKLISKSLTALEQYRTITNFLQPKASHKCCRIATRFKNILENTWPIENENSTIRSYLNKSKYKLNKQYSHKYMCTLKETNTSQNIIPNTIKLSKSTNMSFDHLVPKRLSKESELVLDTVPSLTKYQPSFNLKKRVLSNPMSGVVIINGTESTITPSVNKHRKSQSGTLRSQPDYLNSYSNSHVFKTNEVYNSRRSESQEFIVNDCRIAEEFLQISRIPKYIHRKPKNTNILKSNCKGSPFSKNDKLVKIRNETYLLIRSSTGDIFSISSLQKNDVIPTTEREFYKQRVQNIDYMSHYLKKSINANSNKAKLLIKPRCIQVHCHSCNDSRKLRINNRVKQEKRRKHEIATHGPLHNYQLNISNSKILNKSVQYDETCRTKSGNAKNYKNTKEEKEHKINTIRNSQKQQCYLRKSSSILSVSSTVAIKSQILQSHFQSKLKIHLQSNDEYKTFQVHSNLQSNTRKKNVILQFSGRSLDTDTSSNVIYPSEIVNPVNPHLTGISSLLRRCFCTMNLQVGDGRESRKFQHKLESYKCAPHDCFPYECDPYECQQKIMKGGTRKVSSTDTEKILKYSSNETSKKKKQQSPRRNMCDCRSNYSPKVRSYEKKPYIVKHEELRSDGIYRHGYKTQSSIRKIRNKSSSIGPILKRCLCTVKLLKNEEKNRISNVSSGNISTQSTNLRHGIRSNTNLGNDSRPVYHPGCYCVHNEQESEMNRKKSPKDPASSVSSSVQSHKTSRKRKYIRSKSVYEKPVRSKELRELKKSSDISTRQAVKVGSTFGFSLEFYKDKTSEKPSYKVYEYENHKYEEHSPNRSFKELVTQKDSLTNTELQSFPIKEGQPIVAGSFLKRCFCITKKRSLKKASKYTTMGTEEVIECQCKRSFNEKQSIDKASVTDRHLRSFVLKKNDCIKLINNRYSVDKASGVEKHPRLLVSKECECKQVVGKKYYRSIKAETEKQITKSKSSSVTSSKTSKARISHSSQYGKMKPILLPETVGNEEKVRESLNRQAVRIGSNFSFEIEFHKDLQYPGDDKVQAAAESIKVTRDKMKDKRQIAVIRNKNRSGSSLYSLHSEINTTKKAPKVVAPMIRKCICKRSPQNNESFQKYINKSKQSSIHRGTSTPVSRPVPNFHNRGVMTVYKLKTYPYKLAPYECEPGVCIPGECDPYECLKRMNRRHRGSSTDGYTTKSALSMTRPARRYKDNRVQFSPREKRPHVKETNTRPRKRPREGIEVRQKPKQNKARQAVRIGSNFSFNVEFYKDRSQGSSGRSEGSTFRSQGRNDRPQRGYGRPHGRAEGHTGRPQGSARGPKPCPQPCPKKCPKLCPKTCPNLFLSSGTDAANVNYKNKKAQHKKRQMQNKDSQVWGRKMRSTMTGVGPFLKRCFCTLQLQKRHEKMLPRREERRDSDSSSVGTETARFRPKPHYREQGTRPRGKQTYHGRKLDPNECEPGVCIPGQCDPYVCLERIKRRDMHTRHTGTGGRHRMRSVSSSVTEPVYRRNRNRSVSSSMMHQRRTRGQKTHNQYRSRRNERPNLVKERTYTPSPTSNRQAVRIGSSFSFNIEFYKDRTEQAPRVSAPAGERRVHSRPSGAPVKYVKKPVGPIPKRTKSMSSSNRRNLKNRRMQVNSKTLLKRCFCTLKLQKIGTRQRQTQESTASIGTYYKTAGAQIRQKQEIVPQFRDFGTRTKRRRLEPYECEPGVCIPGECDPYECLERIKQRHLMRHSGTGMSHPHTRSMSNVTPYNLRTRSMNTYRPPRKKDHRRHRESPRRIKQPPPRPSRALENIHNRQAVRLGSSFSFNVEFYKDRSAKSSRSGRSGVMREASCRPSVCKGPTCNPMKCKTSTCSVSCPVKGDQRSRPIQYEGGGHDRMVQAKNAKTESRGSGVPLLKRCFCTLTLQRAEVNTYMIPLRARLYSEKGTLTKKKYFSSESEQQADLKPDYCTPNTCMSDYDPYNSVGPNKKRGFRRISRTKGNHMVRSRDISGGEIGSRFKSFDTQPSGWYGRHQCDTVETIVEEPRFQIFNKPNRKQTVRISSNFNFNIEFFKDSLFPKPCEAEEEFDELSAVTEAINPHHKRKKFREDYYKGSYEGDKQFHEENYRHKHKHKKMSEPIYEGDKLFSIEHYRPKIRPHKTANEKEQNEIRKISKIEKHLDEHSKKIKPEKQLDEHCKKCKPEKQPDELSKKLKPEEAERDIKPDEKTGGPINKILKSLHVSKGKNCPCHLDKSVCLCSSTKDGGKKKEEKEKKKCKCPCSSNGKKNSKTEPSGKKIPTPSKKSKIAEKNFANKITTIARVEMDFYKQKSKPSETLNSPIVTPGQRNEKNNLLWRNVVSVKPKPKYDECNAFTACQVPVNKSMSKILYLYSPNIFWTKSENLCRPCTFGSFNTPILSTRNISAFTPSNITAMSKKRFCFENKHVAGLWLKTKSLNNQPFKANIPTRIEKKYIMQRYVKPKQRLEISKLSMTPVLLCSKNNAEREIKYNISDSGMPVIFLCSSNLRKTKSEYVKKISVCNSMIGIKSECNIRNISYRNLSKKCFCRTQIDMLKTELCESVISVAQRDGSRHLSVFTPKEYWVQYQIQHPKIHKYHKNKQTFAKSKFNEKQQHAQLVTIMPYVPHKFHRNKSKMLFNRVSQLTCNNICSLFCRSNCNFETKSSSNNNFSIGKYHNQSLENTENKASKACKTFLIIKNESHIGSIKIEPWNPSRTNMKTLICQFLRIVSATKRWQNRCFALETSKHSIIFTPAKIYSTHYKRSYEKCSYRTCACKKHVFINKYQNTINSDGVVNFVNTRKTGIKLVKKPHGHCQTNSRKRTCQRRDTSSIILISKDNSNSKQGNESDVFLVQSGLSKFLKKNKEKLVNKSDDTKSYYQTESLCSSSFYNSSRSESKERQMELSSHSVKFNKTTSNLRNLLWCSDCINYKIRNIDRSCINNYIKSSKFNENINFQKYAKEHRKTCSCYFCKKKCISKYPKLKIKIKYKNTIESKLSINPLNFNENDRKGIAIETLDLHNSAICVAKVNKETFDTENITSTKSNEEEKCECLKALYQDDIEKTEQILRNYNYHLLMTKMFICVTKIGLMNHKKVADYESIFSPKRAYRHFKCILLNLKIGSTYECSSGNHTETVSLKQKQKTFAKTIKDGLRKPTAKCLQTFKHIRKLHKRLLPKFLQARKNTVELGFNSLNIACPHIKSHFSLDHMMLRFYPHFLTLLRIWRQLLDVLLFVLWSPCLFSVHLCKAFLCCLIRFRLHCYLK